MNPTVLAPLALRVARRYLAALQTLDAAALDPAVGTERVAREYARREEGSCRSGTRRETSGRGEVAGAGPAPVDRPRVPPAPPPGRRTSRSRDDGSRFRQFRMPSPREDGCEGKKRARHVDLAEAGSSRL